ncbi:GNAT family N-acetyltransferase [Erythrobacter dokdonensis]|uniref:Protein involved in cellulose biosynthesis (CelD) n=1 Tax=Erythrobacter dokdonensis DSW-74 TaxID=1300349 RepID=A0A1A7BGI8_9SPHN|nr:GNAT family N-acetyltransferase [Erythrobacter dokdonensis]OBV10320.1 Protein involved in cellulose biosynthesis (CelD) [Erythrobacter dokdonensis DSW-74]
MKSFPETAFASAAQGHARAKHPDATHGLKVDFLAPSGLAIEERARWARLSARAGPGNIFAQDWFMEPALRHCGNATSLRLAVVRQLTGEWLGVVPLTFETSLGNGPLPSRHTWLATNQFIGTPLILPGAERVFWYALLARLDRRPGVSLALCCEGLPLDDPSTLALNSLCAEQDRLIHCTSRFERPARLARSKHAENPGATRKLDKRLDGLEQRLAQALGPVSFTLHTRLEETDAWIAAFLALERAGWKGRAASALACCTSTAGLFREVIRNGQRLGVARLASLRAGDRIVAMSCWFVDRGQGFGFKMAYGETWRSHAPGRLLMRYVAGHLDDDPPVLFDTCNRPGTPSDALWPDRRELGSFVVAIGGWCRRAMLAGLLDARSRWQERKTA